MSEKLTVLPIALTNVTITAFKDAHRSAATRLSTVQDMFLTVTLLFRHEIERGRDEVDVGHVEQQEEDLRKG